MHIDCREIFVVQTRPNGAWTDLREFDDSTTAFAWLDSHRDQEARIVRRWR